MARSTNRSRRRTRIISFRLDEAEFLRLAHRAAAAGLSVSQLARHLVVSRLDHLKITAHRTCDPALLKQLHHIGHNLNQLVKNAHIFGRLSPQIEPLILRIQALMDEALGDEEGRNRPPAGGGRRKKGDRP